MRCVTFFRVPRSEVCHFCSCPQKYSGTLGHMMSYWNVAKASPTTIKWTLFWEFLAEAACECWSSDLVIFRVLNHKQNQMSSVLLWSLPAFSSLFRLWNTRYSSKSFWFIKCSEPCRSHHCHHVSVIRVICGIWWKPVRLQKLNWTRVSVSLNERTNRSVQVKMLKSHIKQIVVGKQTLAFSFISKDSCNIPLTVC